MMPQRPSPQSELSLLPNDSHDRHVSPSLKLRPEAGMPQPVPELDAREAQADDGHLPRGRPGGSRFTTPHMDGTDLMM